MCRDSKQACETGLPVGTRPTKSVSGAQRNATSFRTIPTQLQKAGDAQGAIQKGNDAFRSLLCRDSKQACETGLPVGTRTRNNAVGGRNFIQLDYG